MAHKLSGDIKAVGAGDALSANWTSDDGVEYGCNGNLDASVPAWSCSAATVTYNATSQLRGNQPLQGYIGKKDLKLTLRDGGVISGSLDTELDRHYEVSGSAKWHAG